MNEFDHWNKEKKRINNKPSFAFASPGEIWWCALGQNVGVEINGKHSNFERPVIILKAFNTEMLFVIPLTTRKKNNKYYVEIAHNNQKTYAVLSQARLISARRIIRKIGKLDAVSFGVVKGAYRALYL